MALRSGDSEVAFQHGDATTEVILTVLGRRFHIAESLDHHQAIIQPAMDSLATPYRKQARALWQPTAT